MTASDQTSRDVGWLQHLPDQAERLSAVEELAQVGTFEVLDLATGRSRWSAECRRLLGVPRVGPTPRYSELVHPEDLPAVRAAIERSMATGEPGGTEHRVVLDGEVRWVAARFAAVPEASAATGTALLGVAMDITDLRRAEAARDRAETSLRVGFARSSVGFGVTDLEGRLVSVNPAYCAIAGYGEDELLGRPTRDLIHPDDREGSSAPRRAMAAGELEVFEAEHRVLRPDGEVRWVRRVVSLVREGEAELYFLTQVEDVTERRAATERITHLAFHDTLTGLANREVLLERTTAALAAAAGTTDEVVCVFLDVDHFKVVNDGLGHAAGDQLLVLLAQRLQAGVRPGDTLARFGGDEFVLVRPGVAAGTAQQLGEDVLATLTAPFPLLGRSVTVTVSAGVAAGRGGSSAEALLRDADSAMYRAKELGRDRVVAFDADLARAVARRLDTEAGLRVARQRGELALHHQPVVDVATGRAVGTEALLRWQHPERGLLGPDEFISVAEETGLIVGIGEWVLTEAVLATQRWRTEVPGAQHLWVAVNVSARQLHDPGFLAAVDRALRVSGLPPQALHLEITESVLMGDADGSARVLAELRAGGVSVVVDDFGTGYSSLSYLTRLPVSALKLDRSFVRGITRADRRDHAVLAAVVSLAATLRLGTVAEGVERPEQLARLAALGVPAAQGFLWSPARPVPELTAWLTETLAG